MKKLRDLAAFADSSPQFRVAYDFAADALLLELESLKSMLVVSL